MAENTTPAKCSEDEYAMAREAGLLVFTTEDEIAIHRFAELVRTQFVPAGQRWFWANSDESQHWRYSDPPSWRARAGDLVVEQLYVAANRKPTKPTNTTEQT